MAKKDAETKDPAVAARERKKGLINIALSTFNKEMDAGSARVVQMIPPDSRLHSELADRIIGPLSAWVETFSDEIDNPLWAAVVEKASDFIEMIGHGLREREGGGKKGVSSATEKPKDPKDWVAGFKKSAIERIQKAADPNAELDKIRKEFKACMVVAAFIQKKLDDEDKVAKGTAPTQQATQPQPYRPLVNCEDLEKFKNQFLRILTTVGEKIPPAAKRVDEKAAGFLSRIANAVERLPGAKSKERKQAEGTLPRDYDITPDSIFHDQQTLIRKRTR